MIMSQGGSGRSTNEGATKTCDDVGSQMEKSAATAWLSIEQQRVWRAWLLGSARITSCLSQELRRHDLELCEYEILASLSAVSYTHLTLPTKRIV